MSQQALAQLVEAFPDRIVSTHAQHGDETAVIRPDALLDVMGFLKNKMGFDFLMDVTAVDYLGRLPRFEVVYHLRSMASGARLRIKAAVEEPADESAPAVPSVVALWPSANWPEREVWDLYGIRFIGHPDLRRILLYEEFVGYPLRKDYPKEKRQPLSRWEHLLPQQEGTSS